MTIKKCRCGKEYEDMGFKTLCPSCFAKSMNNNNYKKANNKDDIILKQTCLKVAGNIVEKGKPTSEVMQKAKQLYNLFGSW